MINFNQSTPYDDLDYTEFKQLVNQCQQCSLHETRTNVVFGSGKLSNNLMIIGEGPGEKEDLEGNPFVGKAGQLLTKILQSVGIDREQDVFIANTVKCRPPGNRTPTKTEINTCNPFLIRQIKFVQPKILLLLGSPSMKMVLGDDYQITKVRGQWFKAPVDYMEDSLYVMPVFHPAYLLRNASKDEGAPKWLTWQDMKEVKAALSFYEQS